MADLEAQLREAMDRSGLNRKQIADRSGVPYSVIWVFAEGSRTITLATASRIADAVGLRGFRKPKAKPRKER